MPSSPPSDAQLWARLRLLTESYRRLTGQPLLGSVPADDAALAAAVWDAPCAIVAHGTEADPVFFYGNRYALHCFEMTFADFARLPSRLSAEPVNQEARERALRQVAAQGYVDGYAGMRIASSGRRFMIEQCTIWNLTDTTGTAHGQAACFIVQDQP